MTQYWRDDPSRARITSGTITGVTQLGIDGSGGSSASGTNCLNGAKFYINQGATTANFLWGTEGTDTYKITSGTGNFALGLHALHSLTTGINNTAIGWDSQMFNTIGTNNTTLGEDAGKFIGNSGTAASNNTCIGYTAGYSTDTGSRNVAIAPNALYTNAAGSYNIAVGYGAGYLSTADDNVYVGAESAGSTTGNKNTMVGRAAGYTGTTTSSSVFLGYGAGYYETGNSKLFIDNAVRSNESDARVKALVYGNFGSTIATQDLQVNGQLGTASYTFATLPTASSFSGKMARATDVGNSGAMLMSDGTRWRPLNGTQSLLANGIAMAVPSSGSMGNNGALTLTTAMAITFANAYFYFPANAIVAGSAAGLYYTVMSSTTVGTVYNNTYTSGTPTIPGSPTAFSTTGPGAYTQTTAADLTLISLTIQASLMGVSDQMRVEHAYEVPNTAGAKFTRVKFGTGATNIGALSVGAGSTSAHTIATIAGRGVNSSQVGHPSFTTGAAIAFATPPQDLTASFPIAVTAQLATATDYLVLNITNITWIAP